MKSILSNDDELFKFIHEKIKQPHEFNQRKSLYYFYKMIGNSLENTYVKLNSIYYAISCSDIVSNIYWTLLIFTNNIKLSMFLCDRAIILFQEYISIYNNNKLHSSIRIEDVKQFIYKKTIGPLSVNIKKIYHPAIQNIYCISDYIKELYQYIFKTCKMIISNDIYKQYINYIYIILEPELYKLTHSNILQIYKHLPIVRITSSNIILYINVVYVFIKNKNSINDHFLEWIDQLFLKDKTTKIDNDYTLLNQHWTSDCVDVNESKLFKNNSIVLSTSQI